MITEKERKRFCSIFSQPLFGSSFSPQMVAIESCISENTVVAPTDKVALPIINAVIPLLPIAVF